MALESESAPRLSDLKAGWRLFGSHHSNLLLLEEGSMGLTSQIWNSEEASLMSFRDVSSSMSAELVLHSLGQQQERAQACYRGIPTLMYKMAQGCVHEISLSRCSLNIGAQIFGHIIPLVSLL